LIDKNIPGPGKYNPARPFGKDALKFALKGRGKSFDLNSKIPGPGTYNNIGLNLNGRYPISTYHNIRAIKFGKKDEQRFNYSCKSYLYR
jgi:hypothetical protein